MMLWCHQSPIDLVAADLPTVQLNYKEGVTQVVNCEYCVELLFGVDNGMDFKGHTFRAVAAHRSNLACYRYRGFLTPPPCSEGVIWFVMHEPLALEPSSRRLRFTSAWTATAHCERLTCDLLISSTPDVNTLM